MAPNLASLPEELLLNVLSRVHISPLAQKGTAMHAVKARHNGQFIALELQHLPPSDQPHPHPPEKDSDIAECTMPMPSFTKSMLSAVAAAASIHHTLGST